MHQTKAIIYRRTFRHTGLFHRRQFVRRALLGAGRQGDRAFRFRRRFKDDDCRGGIPGNVSYVEFYKANFAIYGPYVFIGVLFIRLMLAQVCAQIDALGAVKPTFSQKTRCFRPRKRVLCGGCRAKGYQLLLCVMTNALFTVSRSFAQDDYR